MLDRKIDLLNLSQLGNNGFFTEIISVEGIDHLGTDKLGVESTLAGRVENLLLDRAGIGSPSNNLHISKSIPGDQKKISMHSLFVISEFEVVNNETRFVGRERVNKRFPAVFSRSLPINCRKSTPTSFSTTIVSTPSTLSILKTMYLQYLRSLSLSYKRGQSSVQVIPDYVVKLSIGCPTIFIY